MTTYALVHGAWHGAWCWDRVARHLSGAGHRTVAVDLPCEDLAAGCSAYAEIVLTDVASVDDDLVLVGHSAGGLTLPLVAAARSVKKLVFVAALLPLPARPFAEQNTEEHILLDEYQAGIELDHLGRRRWFDAEVAGRFLYSGCTPADARWAFSHLRPQASTMYTEPSPLREWPEVPVIDIRGTDDRLISAQWSARAVPARLGVSSVVFDGAGHSLLISHARELADFLLGL